MYTTLLTKLTALQNEVALSYHRVRGLYFSGSYFSGDYIYITTFIVYNITQSAGLCFN